ncbi:GSCOCG00009791001-RA-CDS [Cotesia congregata]|nr:GSCOCG00009791001-RA-CDS [Cotesia congregata]
MPWSQYPDKSDFTKLPEQFSDRLNGQFFKRKFRGNNCPRWQSLIILRQRISTSKLARSSLQIGGTSSSC